MKRLCILLACVCAVSCASPTMPTEVARSAAPVSRPASGLSSAVFDATNAERVRAGLSPVTINSQLAFAAQLQADQCARAGRIEHVLVEAQYPRPEDRIAAAGYAWQQYGENLAVGFDTGETAVQGWMASPGHRANILHAAFTEIGVAVATDTAGRAYYIQVFGRPR